MRNRIKRLLLPWCRSPRIGRRLSSRTSDRNIGGNLRSFGWAIRKHMIKDAVVMATLSANQHIAPVMVGSLIKG